MLEGRRRFREQIANPELEEKQDHTGLLMDKARQKAIFTASTCAAARASGNVEISSRMSKHQDNCLGT